MSSFGITEVNFELNPAGMYVPQHERIAAVPTQPSVDPDQLHAVMDMAEYYDGLKTSDGANQEIVVMNADKAANGVMFQESTSFSSAAKNPANMGDLARRAVDYPDVAQVYMASAGNHPADRMPRPDRKYLKATSRYTVTDTDGTVRPVDTFMRRAELLHSMDLLPTHFVADEEVGRLVMAWMLAVGPDNIKGTFIRGLNGISGHHSNVQSLKDDMESRMERRVTPEDAVEVGDLTPLGIKDIKKHMPQIYHGLLNNIAHRAPLPVFLFPADDINKLTLVRAYGKHNDLGNLAVHALFQDTAAAIQNQDAPMVLAFNNDSKQHDKASVVEFATAVMNTIPEDKRTDSRTIKLLFAEGVNTTHETNPRAADSIRAAGLKGTGGHLFRVAAQGFGFKPFAA